MLILFVFVRFKIRIENLMASVDLETVRVIADIKEKKKFGEN